MLYFTQPKRSYCSLCDNLFNLFADMLFNCYHLPVSLQRLMGERRFARYVYRISSGYRLLFSQACITEFYDLLSGWSWGSQRALLGRQILCSIAPGATRKIHHIDHCRLGKPKLPAPVFGGVLRWINIRALIWKDDCYSGCFVSISLRNSFQMD
jgi:hypothetical protein